MKPELQRQNALMMICRVIMLSALLLCGLVISRLLKQPLVGSHHFYLLIGAGYGLTVLYALLHPFWSRHPASACVQVTGDILLITGIVYVTGGIDSPFPLLYFLPVIAASIMLGRGGAMTAAGGAWVVYAFLVVLIVYGWIPDMPPGLSPAPSESLAPLARMPAEAAAMNKRVAYTLLSHFLGFLTVAHLASYLTQELKAAGDELREKSEVLASIQALNKNIIDSITSGIITTDLTGTITFMNRGAEEIIGKRLGQGGPVSLDAFLEHDEPLLEPARQNLETERRFRFETSLARADGATLYLGFTSAVLKDQRGAPLGYIFSFQDLTDIKALEEEVRLKDRMAALGQMAAGIAHEIRNPLASMSGSVQILKKSVKPSEEEAELLDIVLRESKRLDGIIRDFLLFAKPRPFRPEPADIVPVLKESLTLLRNSPEFAAGHTIETDFDAGRIEALIDVDMIKQVFWNLAKNALKAMPEGGALRVSARTEGRSAILVSFTDQGIGMNAAEIRRAFEPFQTSFQEGTGLGLAVVFRIVQEHHGQIRIRCPHGRGTEVTVALPSTPVFGQTGRPARAGATA